MLLSSRSRAGRVAGGGLLTALILLFITMSFVSPTADLAILSLSSLCVAVAVVRYDSRTAVYVALAAGLLAIVWPGLFFALPFITFFGPWPIIKAWIEKRTNTIDRKISGEKDNRRADVRSWNTITSALLKQAAATLLILVAGLIYMMLFSVDVSKLLQIDLLSDLPASIFWLIIFAAVELAIFFYDWALTLLITWYMRRLHSRV